MRLGYAASVLIAGCFLFGGCEDPNTDKDPAVWGGGWETFLDSGTVITMAAREDNVVAVTNNGVLLSLDQGEYWEPTSLPVTTTSILMRTDRWFAATSEAELFTSSDWGLSWKPSPAIRVGDRLTGNVRLTSFGMTIFAAIRGRGVYRTTDDGQSWERASAGIDSVDVASIFGFNSILFSGPVLQDAIFLSRDFGDTWQPIDSGYAGSSVLDFVSHRGYVFAAAADRGVYRSADRGTSWSAQPEGFPAKQYVQSLAASRDVVYAAGAFSNADLSEKHMLYRSLDRGAKWSVADEGMTGVAEITSITLSNKYLLAGTRGKGVWRRKLVQD